MNSKKLVNTFLSRKADLYWTFSNGLGADPDIHVFVVVGKSVNIKAILRYGRKFHCSLAVKM